MDSKEKRGIYNVTFNDKKATPIKLKSDIDIVEDAIIDKVVAYIKGWHNIKRDKGMGANHIKLHLEPDSNGSITTEELLNLGNSLRKYSEIFEKPFIDNKTKYSTAKNYEWQDENGVRFRCIIDNQNRNRGEGHIPPLSPSDDYIITFYSDRNLNERMKFKNPNVETYYALQKKLGKVSKTIIKEINKQNKDKSNSEKEIEQ